VGAVGDAERYMIDGVGGHFARRAPRCNRCARPLHCVCWLVKLTYGPRTPTAGHSGVALCGLGSRAHEACIITSWASWTCSFCAPQDDKGNADECCAQAGVRASLRMFRWPLSRQRFYRQLFVWRPSLDLCSFDESQASFALAEACVVSAIVGRCEATCAFSAD
jgi:hypothetical protein